MAKKRPSKPGASAQAKSLAPGQVIDQLSQEEKALAPDSEGDTTTASDTDTTAATESAEVTEAPSEAAEPEKENESADAGDPSEAAGAEGEADGGTGGAEAPSASVPFEEVTLGNGVKITADTVMQCGRCGARFYAKDVTSEDGSCPATGADPADASKIVVCGGVLGPKEA